MRSLVPSVCEKVLAHCCFVFNTLSFFCVLSPKRRHTVWISPSTSLVCDVLRQRKSFNVTRLRNKHVLRAFKPRQKFGRIREQISEIRDAFKDFHLLDKSLPSFHQAMKARRTRFISFIKLLFSDVRQRERRYIRSLYA